MLVHSDLQLDSTCGHARALPNANGQWPIYRIYGVGHKGVTNWERSRVECSLSERTVHAGTTVGGTGASLWGLLVTVLDPVQAPWRGGGGRGASHQASAVAAVSSTQHAMAGRNMAPARMNEPGSLPWPCMPIVRPLVFRRGGGCAGAERPATAADRGMQYGVCTTVVRVAVATPALPMQASQIARLFWLSEYSPSSLTLHATHTHRLVHILGACCEHGELTAYALLASQVPAILDTRGQQQQVAHR